MTKKSKGAKLTVAEAAERAGMAPSTWRAHVARAKKERAAGRERAGLAPAPDGHYDQRTPWWYEATVDEYLATRPGQSGRPRKQA